jgi:anaerobic nitric oxide reductase transcription regulator
VRSDLPDPFDGLLEHDPRALTGVHACIGCPLWIEDELVGILTADALSPSAFDDIDLRFLAAIGALAAAAMRTSHLIQALEAALERQDLVARDLMQADTQRKGHEIIGVSKPIDRLRQEIELVARSDFTVLITGETGTGKELVARSVHASSARHDQPLIYVNCSALAESLVESELFGHLRGAFTGATSDRAGKFEVADQGTLFLDEIGELPLGVQPKLLRALQQGEIQRVGSDTTRTVDVRIIAATNRDLQREVDAGRFRADLFHRLNVYPLHVPPVRDEARRRLGTGPVRLTAEALAALRRYSWPGNVRELENVLSRVTLRSSINVSRARPLVLEERSFLPTLAEALSTAPDEVWGREEQTSTSQKSLREAVEDFQRTAITRAVANASGNWSAAARALGMHRSNLYHLAVRLGLKNLRRD